MPVSRAALRGRSQGCRHREWSGSPLKFISLIYVCGPACHGMHTHTWVRVVIPGSALALCPHLTREYWDCRCRCALLHQVHRAGHWGDGPVGKVLAMQTHGPDVKSLALM